MDPLRSNAMHPSTQHSSTNGRVVEVVDCLSDTVVSVTHLDARGPRLRRQLVLACAIVSLSIFALSFAKAVSIASSNKRALVQHLHRGEPSHSFRPQRIGSAHEAIGGLALLTGIGLSLAFFAMRSQTRSRFQAESPASDSQPRFDMVAVGEQGAELKVHPEMSVSFSDSNLELDAEALVARSMAQLDSDGWMSMKLPDAGRLSLRYGHRAYHLAWSPRPASGILSPAAGLDSRFGAYLGAAAAAVLLFVGLLDALPIEESQLYGEGFSPSERYIAIREAALESAVVEPDKGDEGDRGDTAPAEASEAGDIGTAGIESAVNERASMAIEKRAEEASMAREQHMATSASSGILGIMASREIFANSNALAAYSSGDAGRDWYGGFDGGVVGDQVGELSGSWGNDVRGMGQWGTVKVGNRLPGLHYGSHGGCDSSEPCRGTGVSLHRKSQVPTFSMGDATASGGLDREIIRRYIKKQKLRITHCYEKRLLVDNELAGTLTANFSIGSNGLVIGAKASGMGDDDLQQCVASVVASIHFPSTENGALVNVSYPFTFQPAGH